MTRPAHAQAGRRFIKIMSTSRVYLWAILTARLVNTFSIVSRSILQTKAELGLCSVKPASRAPFPCQHTSI
ncbi:hypothetical protein DFJ43DRAFT_503968 [Lentinula guzmanii]|uniref:Uncharacterized protein n=1 Tax=Lentinula guzmanii TaxID=2804957 RepID=A0AA38MZ52_9AGAR|nr:hypothetical protein DFJ43DRAFT_503968 [Lentinula guzmanii]